MSEYGYLFDEIDMNADQPIKGRVKTTRLKDKMKLIQRLQELKQVMPPIEKNTTYHLISSDNFGSIELLKHLVEQHKPVNIYITTWSINQEFMDMLTEYLKRGIQVDFYIDKSIKGRKAHLAAQVVNLAYDYNNLNLKYHYLLHSKVTLITNGDEFISIEGSANYSKNTRIENFTITESKELFNFHKNWMQEIVGK